jgi:hypothetical protein
MKGEVTNNNEDHARLVLFACEVGGQYQNQNGHRNGGYSQGKLDVLGLDDDNGKLNGKTEEKEEIELE